MPGGGIHATELPGMEPMSAKNGSSPDDVTFSVLIGRVSTADTARVFETLDALTNQEGADRFEILVADRINDAITAQIEKKYPHVRLIRAPLNTTLPALRQTALRQSTGAFIVVTEDHCVPARDWLAKMKEAFAKAPAGTVAVGGCVENGVGESALDWATFFCEYGGFLKPVGEGEALFLPGMNTAYRRSALLDLETGLLTKGFWETTVHPVLRARGYKFFSSNGITVYHKKKFSLSLFVTQRFLYSRYFAGLRFEAGEGIMRLLAFCGTVVLPLLILYRLCRSVWIKRRLRKELLLAMPFLFLFSLVWALGEMAGYAAGGGNALSKLE